MKRFASAATALIALLGVASACEVPEDKSGSTKPAPTPTLASTKGKGPVTWGNWELVGRRVHVTDDLYGNYDLTFTVKNTGDASDTGLFTVVILRGTTVLGRADCKTPDIPGGSTGVANCTSQRKFKKGWTELRFKDSF